MKKLYVEDMSKEQLAKVLEANNKLANEVYDDMVDSEMHWVGEQLDYVRKSLSNWSIGPDNRNYLVVSNSDGFIDGLIEMDNGIPLFSDNDKHIIYDTAKLRDEFFAMEEPYEGDFEDEEGYLDDEAYDKAQQEYYDAEERYERAVKELAEAVANQYTVIFDNMYNYQVLLDYFLDFYQDARMDEGTFFINEEDDSFELFEDVAYTKSYK